GPAARHHPAAAPLSVPRGTPPGHDRVVTIAELVRRHALPEGAEARLGALLDALAAEPDPHTTIRDRDEAVALHLADSLAGLEVEALRSARRLADVGAGAGFPGLPLAVALPDAEVD